MKNYERYKNITATEYDKKGLFYFLWRIPSDKKIFPIINSINNKFIYDVGCGTGNYTKILLKNDNRVIGIDLNPHLCRLPIKIYKEDAISFADKVKEGKADVVFAGWLTEYLNRELLLSFFREAYKALPEDGEFIATIIDNRGWGWLYVKLAKKIRGICKYYYKKETTLRLLKKVGFKNIQIINLNSWLRVPWAYLIRAKKDKKVFVL